MGRSRSRSPRKKSSRKRSRSREKKRRRRHSSSESDLDHKRRRDKTYVRFLNLFEATNFFYFSSQRSTGKIISLYVVDYWWIFLITRTTRDHGPCRHFYAALCFYEKCDTEWIENYIQMIPSLKAICHIHMHCLHGRTTIFVFKFGNVDLYGSGTSMKLLFKYSFMALLLISMLTTK